MTSVITQSISRDFTVGLILTWTLLVGSWITAIGLLFSSLAM